MKCTDIATLLILCSILREREKNTYLFQALISSIEQQYNPNCLKWRKCTAAPNQQPLTSLCGNTRHRWWASPHLSRAPTSRWTSLFRENDIVSVWASLEGRGLQTGRGNQNAWNNWISSVTEGRVLLRKAYLFPLSSGRRAAQASDE